VHAKNSQIHKFSQAYHGWPRSAACLLPVKNLAALDEGLASAQAHTSPHLPGRARMD
jgi:hypothetical protein